MVSVSSDQRIVTVAVDQFSPFAESRPVTLIVAAPAPPAAIVNVTRYFPEPSEVAVRVTGASDRVGSG